MNNHEHGETDELLSLWHVFVALYKLRHRIKGLPDVFENIKLVNVYQAPGDDDGDDWESHLKDQEQAWITTFRHYLKDGLRVNRKASGGGRWHGRNYQHKTHGKTSWHERKYNLVDRTYEQKIANKYTMFEYLPDEDKPKYALCRITIDKSRNAHGRPLSSSHQREGKEINHVNKRHKGGNFEDPTGYNNQQFLEVFNRIKSEKLKLPNERSTEAPVSNIRKRPRCTYTNTMAGGTSTEKQELAKVEMMGSNTRQIFDALTMLQLEGLPEHFKDIKIVNVYEAPGVVGDDWTTHLNDQGEAWIITPLHYSKGGSRIFRKTLRNCRWDARTLQPKKHGDTSWNERKYKLVEKKQTGLQDYTMIEYTSDEDKPKHALCRITIDNKKYTHDILLSATQQPKTMEIDHADANKGDKGETSLSLEPMEQELKERRYYLPSYNQNIIAPGPTPSYYAPTVPSITDQGAYTAFEEQQFQHGQMLEQDEYVLEPNNHNINAPGLSTSNWKTTEPENMDLINNMDLLYYEDIIDLINNDRDLSDTIDWNRV